MNQALNEVVDDDALRKELSAAFAKVADHMRNREDDMNVWERASREQ